MTSPRAVMTLALLAATGVDVEGAMRAARQAEAPPPPEPGKPVGLRLIPTGGGRG